MRGPERGAAKGGEATAGLSGNSFCRVGVSIYKAPGQKSDVHEVRCSQKLTSAVSLQPLLLLTPMPLLSFPSFINLLRPSTTRLTPILGGGSMNPSPACRRGCSEGAGTSQILEIATGAMRRLKNWLAIPTSKIAQAAAICRWLSASISRWRCRRAGWSSYQFAQTTAAAPVQG